MDEKTRARAPEKILRCALALLLAAATLLSSASPALAAEPAYESGRGVTLAEKLGFDPEAFVANLEAHQDRYLGTPTPWTTARRAPASAWTARRS